MALVDVLVSLGVVLGFAVLIFTRLREKYPKLRPWLDQWYPGTIYQSKERIIPTKKELEKDLKIDIRKDKSVTIESKMKALER